MRLTWMKRQRAAGKGREEEPASKSRGDENGTIGKDLSGLFVNGMPKSCSRIWELALSGSGGRGHTGLIK